jgi:hypothetical protein
MVTPVTEVPFRSREEIEASATGVLRSCGATHPPFSAFEIARHLGVPVEEVEFDDGEVAGQLIRGGGRSKIRIRGDDPLARKNFTIAHELGHYLLHPTGDWSDTEVVMYRRAYWEDVSGVARAEFQANLFAAALLMPEPSVREYWAKLGSPYYLAPIYRVSNSAMLRRLEELGIVVPSVEGFLYADLSHLAEVTGAPKSAPPSDDRGPIPAFPPVAVDERGRILPMERSEQEERRAAAIRALDAIARIGDPGEPPEVAEQVMRGIDEGRPLRKLFDGMY